MRTPLALAFISLSLCGCETTGDPRQGGLFGWSEAKARTRLTEREQTLAEARQHLNAESGRTRSLRTQQGTLSSEIAHASDAAHAKQQLRNERLQGQLQSQYAATLQRAKALEDDAFTSATASRARRLRSKVEGIGRDTSLSPEERIARLRAMDSELSAERSQTGR